MEINMKCDYCSSKITLGDASCPQCGGPNGMDDDDSDYGLELLIQLISLITATAFVGVLVKLTEKQLVELMTKIPVFSSPF
jgi:hypothetical protein